MDFSNAKFIIA